MSVVLVATSTSEIATLGIFAGLERLTFNFTLPLMFALAAEIDHEGRWAAALGGVFTIATGCGPIVGGVLVETTGYLGIGWLNVVATLPAIALFGWVRKMNQDDGGSGAAST